MSSPNDREKVGDVSEQEPNKVKLVVTIRNAWLPLLTIEQLQRIVAILDEVTP